MGTIPDHVNSRIDRTTRIILQIGALFVGLLFVAASIGKTIDPSRTNDVILFLINKYLSSVRSIPHSIASDIGVGILVGLECAVGGLLCLAPKSRVVLAGACALLVLFTAILLALAFDPTAPACGCLGILKAGRGAQNQAWLGIARNVAAIWILAWIFIWTRRPAADAPVRKDVAVPVYNADNPPSPRGFTLIELLVVLVIVGVLLSLALPAFRKVRSQAKIAVNLSLQRQVHSALMAYASDFNDSFVYLATPGRPYNPIEINGVRFSYPSYFGGQSSYYVSILVDKYLSRNDLESHQTSGKHVVLFRNDIDGVSPLYMARFRLTNTVAAAPEYWIGTHPPTELSLLRGTRVRDVLFPSSKALTVDFQTGFFESSIRQAQNRSPMAHVGFADGSGSSLQWASALESLNFVERPFGARNWPIYTTSGGLHGRDR